VTALIATTILVPLVLVVLVPRLLPSAPARPAAWAASVVSRSREAEPQPPTEDRTPRILGRILDADGNAVDAATVRLVSPSPPYSIYRETRTDPAGRFTLERVPVQRARVVADHDTAGIVASAELRIAQGETTELTLVLAAGSAVEGTVVDEHDRPIQGAALSAEGAPWMVRRATSDANGAFRITTVPQQATTLVAVARGFQTARIPLPSRYQAGRSIRVRLAAALEVEGEVRDSDGNPVKALVVACEGQAAEARVATADDGTFRLPASTVGCNAVAERDEYGTSDPVAVFEARHLSLRFAPGGSIEGVVVDERGSSATQFTVGIESFSGTSGRAFPSAVRKAFEDARGSFRLDRLAPGRYVLTASAPSRPPARSAAIAVSSGAVTRGVRIVLPRGGTVMGHVYDENHQLLRGVDLGFDAVSSVLDSTAYARTDETGEYRLEGAPAGPFTLRVQKDGFRVRLISGLRVASNDNLTQDVTLPALGGGATLEFGGIGATLAQSRDGIAFGAVFPGNPAERAGLLGGDRIVGIDGQDIGGLSMADVLQILRGRAGTAVGLSVYRPSTGQDLDVVVERSTILH
jgi:hypothetical protein